MTKCQKHTEQAERPAKGVIQKKFRPSADKHQTTRYGKALTIRKDSWNKV